MQDKMKTLFVVNEEIIM